ncbi:uncharacterized protein LOC120120625 [Hibiscus syriacus]|uniref:uncharacterized protein LOC120120625 n=1 Tax=Hibiscus syriacus TaxID=106335 RepID=UPI00192228AA|nr:uncharacterized protein LOC120120625 [Hibiscus syriacus]
MDIPSNSSWTFKRIMKLRSLVYPILSVGFKCTKSLWEDVRLKNNKVSWQKLIWYPIHIPKHNIITWMIILDPLPTKDRLQKFGIIVNSQCILCSETNKTRNHLFADCKMAGSIWRSLLLLLSGIHKPQLSWSNLLIWVSATWKGKSLITSILKLSWCAFNYTIWEERNHRLFRVSASFG